MNMKTFLTFLATCLLLFSVVGCSSGTTGVVTGVVTIDGEPADGIEVMFSPVGHDGAPAMGFTRDGGKFQLMQGRGNRSISAGKYKVSVTRLADEESGKPSKGIARQFKTPNDSPITEEIVPGKNQIDIPIASK
ncbi:hypothetical protein ACYFX5_26330 [Bremerella sp. T1]|uniref:hypothetical protein n=1 Tax=Bremerella sp. TYQ1 TaxID=3119568 RepID=UPI001CCD12E3|nr:hypothetical protein [Bremerella volcania]UBM36527.1 hypothetical protein LA756_01180 [Bremerella volcania]